MEDVIRMADGTEIRDAYAVPGGGRLYIYIQGSTMRTVCEMLTDPEKTARMEYRGQAWEGYTELMVLQKTGAQIGAGLARPET